MNDLLKLAVEAHGGLDRWNQLKTLTANISVTRALWHLKGRPDILKGISIEAPLHRERLTTYFPGENRRATFSPDRIVIETEGGDFLESRENPRAAFQGHTMESPWDDFHLIYFSSYALWNYLTAPFLYTWPGFETEELAPWQESGEVWRPLKITYPDSIASHTREQVAYYGRDGLLRRHAYTVDVLGGTSGLNYAFDYRDVNGIMVPTTRRVYPPTPTRRKPWSHCWSPSTSARLPSLKLADDQSHHAGNLPQIPMANVPEQKTTNESKEQSPQTDPGSKPYYDAIALAAYFIALDRHARGEAPDPLKDWLEAERQLTRAV